MPCQSRGYSSSALGTIPARLPHPSSFPQGKARADSISCPSSLRGGSTARHGILIRPPGWHHPGMNPQHPSARQSRHPSWAPQRPPGHPDARLRAVTAPHGTASHSSRGAAFDLQKIWGEPDCFCDIGSWLLPDVPPAPTREMAVPRGARDTQAGGTCPKGGEGILALKEPWHIPLQSTQPLTTSLPAAALLYKALPCLEPAMWTRKGCLSPSQLAPHSAASAQQPWDDAVASECPQPLLCSPGPPAPSSCHHSCCPVGAQSHPGHREWISSALSLPCPFLSC